MSNRNHLIRAAMTLALSGAVLGGCESRSTADAAASARLEEIGSAATERLAALKRAQCRDPEAEAALSELATEVSTKFARSPGSVRILRSMMESGCVPTQSVVVVQLRQLRPMTEGRTPSADVGEVLLIGLGSTDAKLRYLTAMTVHELRVDPRGSKIADKLASIASSDPDDRAKQTAAWVREQLGRLYPAK